jgi:hypothetical protein
MAMYENETEAEKTARKARQLVARRARNAKTAAGLRATSVRAAMISDDARDACLALADAHEAETVPEVLGGLFGAAAIAEALKRGFGGILGNYQAAERKAALVDLLSAYRAAK